MIKRAMSKPITWGDYLKLSGVICGIYAICAAIWVIRYYWEDIMSKFKNLFHKKSKVEVDY